MIGVETTTMIDGVHLTLIEDAKATSQEKKKEDLTVYGPMINF